MFFLSVSEPTSLLIIHSEGARTTHHPLGRPSKALRQSGSHFLLCIFKVCMCVYILSIYICKYDQKCLYFPKYSHFSLYAWCIILVLHMKLLSFQQGGHVASNNLLIHWEGAILLRCYTLSASPLKVVYYRVPFATHIILV